LTQTKKTLSNADKKIAVVMPIRNEEKFIEKTLTSLFNQDLKPYRIIVINDNSTDNTEEILKTFPIQIVNSNRNTETDLNMTKEIYNVLNLGMSKLKNDQECQYILKLDGDHLLPKDYLSKLISRMEEEPKLAICSGVIEGEYSVNPRHSGRIYRYDFLKKFGVAYPVNYGSEDYFLFKAESMGLKVTSFQDVVTQTLRKTTSLYQNHQTFYNYGLAMKALGYSFSFVFAKALLSGIRSPKSGIFLLKGFFDKNIELFEPELREFVKKKQSVNLFQINSQSIKRVLNLIKN
jgi:glycosyltransferase involved in cell wall biosynthesis